MRVLGVTEAKNLKNLGMYGVGKGMFEARLRHQASGNKKHDHGTSLLKFTFSSMCYSEFMERYAGCTSMVTFAPIFLKCWHDSLI